MEPAGDSRSYSTMVCPSCQHAWFHRACIQVGALPFPHPVGTAGAQQHQARLTLTLLVFLLQGMAKSAGLRCFQCPLCRDRERFIQEMINLGIHIPVRLVPFIHLSSCEGTRAVPSQGLPQQAWPFGAGMALVCLSLEALSAHHIPSLLWQKTKVGDQPCLRIPGSSAPAL